MRIDHKNGLITNSKKLISRVVKNKTINIELILEEVEYLIGDRKDFFYKTYLKGDFKGKKELYNGTNKKESIRSYVCNLRKFNLGNYEINTSRRLVF